MEKIRCPHCGSYINESDNNYYACENCSTMFHTIVAADGSVEAELD